MRSKEDPFNNIETRPDLTSLRSSSNLIHGVLGFFDLKQSATIFPAAHRSTEALLYTTYHEKSHERLIKVTSFGKFQSVLAMLADEAHLLPHHLQNAKEMLSQTMKASWYAHEGYATYNEYSLASLSARRSLNLGRMNVLPDDYADALSLYRGIVATLPEEMSPFDRYFADAVAQTAFNTSILSDLPLERLDDASLVRHLTPDTNRPDGRLNLLSEIFRETGVRLDDWSALRGDIERSFRDIGVPHGHNAQTYVDDIRTDHSPDALVMRRRLRRILVDLFAGIILKLCPWAGGMLPTQAHEQADRYHEDVRKAVEVYGVSIPRLANVNDLTPADTQLLHLGVELPPTRRFGEYVVRDGEASRIVETLLKEEKGASFFVELRALTSSREGPKDNSLRYRFRITLIGWESPDMTADGASPVATASRKPVPATPQLTFFGSAAQLRPVFESISSRALGVVLGAESLDPEFLKSDESVFDLSSVFGDWRGRFYSFYGSTHTYSLVKILERWKAGGVTEIWYGGKNPFLTYYSVILDGGLRWILVVPSVLPPVLAQEHVELFEWFVRCVETATPGENDEARKEEFRQFRLVTFLNELGAFTDTSSK